MQLIRVPCSKLYRAHDSRVRPVAVAVVHWTASPPRGPGVADPARIKAWLADNSRETSTGFTILRDGVILQAADLDERTWHAGGSVWRDSVGAEHRGVNLQSIGFDLENVGPVRKSPAGDGWIDAYGGRYKGAEPTKTGRGYFEPYTPAQLAALDEFVRWLAAHVPILRDPARWTGHENIQPGKLDPGPLFPWAAVRAAVSQG